MGGLDVIVKLAGSGMIMLCVPHEMGFTRQVVERGLLLDSGRIVEDPPSEEFFGAPKSSRAKVFLRQIVYGLTHQVVTGKKPKNDPYAAMIATDRKPPTGYV